MEEYIYYGTKLQVADTADYDNCGGTMYAGEYDDAKEYLEDLDDDHDDHDDYDDDESDFGVLLSLIGATLFY